MNHLINISNLVKHYDDFSLESVNLTVEAGSVVGFIGSNGAGKTTTIKALLGLITADEGTVELLEEPVLPNTLALARLKNHIGVVFDTCSFPSACRVADVGRIGRAAYSTWNRDHFNELCHTFGLAPAKKISELSRGMGMKLTLAFALAHNPELLVLDEATAGLDPMARDEVLDILRTFMNQPTHGILLSTHITSDLEKIADRVTCIDKGRIVFDLPKEAISDEAGVAHLRDGQLEAVRESNIIPIDQIRMIRGSYGTDLLIPDRFAFVRTFPDLIVEAATIEDYMTLTLKGESQ